MTRVNYNLEVTELQNFLIQVRILKPELPLRSIEVLYYVWKYPNEYVKQLIKNKLYKNVPVVNTTLNNFVDMELLIVEKPTKGNQFKKLSPDIESKLIKGNAEINIKLNQI